MYKKLKLEKELVLFDFQEYKDGHRLKIECTPERLLAKHYVNNEIWTEGVTVQGRHIYGKKEIPLKSHQKNGKDSKPLAYVKVDFQIITKTGSGSITNLEYHITKLPKQN